MKILDFDILCKRFVKGNKNDLQWIVDFVTENIFYRKNDIIIKKDIPVETRLLVKCILTTMDSVVKSDVSRKYYSYIMGESYTFYLERINRISDSNEKKKYSNSSTLLVNCAKNKIEELVRKCNKYDETISSYNIDDLYCGDIVYSHAHLISAHNTLYNVLKHVKSNYRSCIINYFCDNMSMIEIGNLIGVTRITVRDRIAKGLRQLRNPARSKRVRDLLSDEFTEAYYLNSIDSSVQSSNTFNMFGLYNNNQNYIATSNCTTSAVKERHKPIKTHTDRDDFWWLDDFKRYKRRLEGNYYFRKDIKSERLKELNYTDEYYTNLCNLIDNFVNEIQSKFDVENELRDKFQEEKARRIKQRKAEEAERKRKIKLEWEERRRILERKEEERIEKIKQNRMKELCNQFSIFKPFLFSFHYTSFLDRLEKIVYHINRQFMELIMYDSIPGITLKSSIMNMDMKLLICVYSVPGFLHTYNKTDHLFTSEEINAIKKIIFDSGRIISRNYMDNNYENTKIACRIAESFHKMKLLAIQYFSAIFPDHVKHNFKTNNLSSYEYNDFFFNHFLYIMLKLYRKEYSLYTIRLGYQGYTIFNDFPYGKILDIFNRYMEVVTLTDERNVYVEIPDGYKSILKKNKIKSAANIMNYYDPETSFSSIKGLDEMGIEVFEEAAKKANLL